MRQRRKEDEGGDGGTTGWKRAILVVPVRPVATFGDSALLGRFRSGLGLVERETTVTKLQSLLLRHLAVLAAAVGTCGSDGHIIQPVRTSRIHNRLQQPSTAERLRLGERTVQ